MKMWNSDQRCCASQTKEDNQGEQDKGFQVIGFGILIGMYVELNNEEYQWEQQWHNLWKGRVWIIILTRTGRKG